MFNMAALPGGLTRGSTSMTETFNRVLIGAFAAAVMTVVAMAGTMVAASQPVAFGQGLSQQSQG